MQKRSMNKETKYGKLAREQSRLLPCRQSYSDHMADSVQTIGKYKTKRILSLLMIMCNAILDISHDKLQRCALFFHCINIIRSLPSLFFMAIVFIENVKLKMSFKIFLIGNHQQNMKLKQCYL